jgi:hypothetical protein
MKLWGNMTCGHVLHICHQQQVCIQVVTQTLPPWKQDKMTSQFEELKATINHPDPKQHPRNDWISTETWWLVAHRTMLSRTGCLCRAGRCRLKEAYGLLCGTTAPPELNELVGKIIEAKLRGGDVQEAFRHLQVEAHPCF